MLRAPRSEKSTTSLDDAVADKRLKPPYQVENNEFTLLEETDLVIDPIGTGYVVLFGEETIRMNSVFRRDLDSVGEFIRLYTSRNERWSSPKF